ncbi:MAG: Adenylosuccinate lyase [Parcubacteria group bacterium Gr01-1014_48]|nr:MAG: Adenylosuccinate lyase [Parcubacteria group bacterium Gr01-1014_48]
MSICPLDDRYRKETAPVREIMAGPALAQARVEVEIRYLIALSDEPGVIELPRFTTDMQIRLKNIYENFDAPDYYIVLDHENNPTTGTRHDVKAIEYWLRNRLAPLHVPVQFVHFALTSEDVTNLAYGLLINRLLCTVIDVTLSLFIGNLRRFARKHINAPLLGMTHLQPATPTTVGEQLLVFTDRLKRKLREIRKFRMHGKFGGAVGNLSAHYAAYPDVNWHEFRTKFVRSLGLSPLKRTTQINPHDDIARLSHLMSELNGILIDLAQDMPLYIGRGVFCLHAVPGEVGSSTMPHKVNPTDWETAKGALGAANALFDFFARELPVNKLQRELCDSIIQRFIGEAFAAHHLAVVKMLRGLEKVSINTTALLKEIDENPEVFGEAIQTVMRRYGYVDAYEQLKEMTRGKRVTIGELCPSHPPFQKGRSPYPSHPPFQKGRSPYPSHPPFMREALDFPLYERGNEGDFPRV